MSTKTLVKAASEKDVLTFSEAFDELMRERLVKAINEKKEAVAKTIVKQKGDNETDDDDDSDDDGKENKDKKKSPFDKKDDDD